jgi:hypothetical protein
MSGSVLEKFSQRSANHGPEEEAGLQDDLGAFGMLRGAHERAIMLELRLANGNSLAFNYSYLVQATFDPSLGILLQFGGKRVTISGSHLNAEVRPNVRLFQALLRHRVTWIRETDRLPIDSLVTAQVIVDEIGVDE